MAKRAASPDSFARSAKRLRTALATRIATPDAAARADACPPLRTLLGSANGRVKPANSGDAVIYWMRMEDMRVYDNRALARASEQARKDSVPLVTLFIISPEDYVAHDRSPRRIDFMLRNLRSIKSSLSKLHIPLHILTHTPRCTLPSRVIKLMEDINAFHLFANIEYEFDELHRDIRVANLVTPKGRCAEFIHDKLVVEPGVLNTKQGKPYTVYSPFQRSWIALVNSNTQKYTGEAHSPSPNDESIHSHPIFSRWFDTEVPREVEGFRCSDAEIMSTVWPEGSDAARKMLDAFLHCKPYASHVGIADPLSGTERSEKHSRARTYKDNRDRTDKNTTSRLSPYLASGVISVRECLRSTLEFLNTGKFQDGKDTGLGVWIQEIAWRDFYSHILAEFPRVSMGVPFQQKYDSVKWETNDEHLEAWKNGLTGVPIVDAAMRQAKTMGWMHNRARMIAAMYLVKDLMIDWRLGERHFMQQFIDGDLASNNGGWQWCASTGTDPQPYFRIMNPYKQSEKADPHGDYIRTFVPELARVYGADIHNPPAKLADKLGYPRPLVDHQQARQRALRRYKNPGDS